MPAPRERTRPLPARWWEYTVAGLAFSLITALSFPPVDLWPLTFVAIVPLVWISCREGKGPLWAGVYVWLGVLPLWVFEERWLISVTEVGYPLICLYLSLYAGCFVALLSMTRRAATALPLAVLVPILWAALEFLRGEITLTGYAWFLVGQPVIHVPALAMPAGFLGSYFVSFLVAAFAGALGDAAGLSRWARWTGGASALAIAALWTLTAIIGATGHSPDSRSITVGLVQTNVPQSNKLVWTIESRLEEWRRMSELTRQAAAARPRPDLIVLPETMFPGDALNSETWPTLAKLVWELKGATPPEVRRDYFIPRLLELQADIGVPMLAGAQAVEGLRLTDLNNGSAKMAFDARYNSVFLVWQGRVQVDRYDKISLTPFGEVIPYVWRWPGLQKLIMNVGAGGMKFDLTSGSALTVFEAPVSRSKIETVAGPMTPTAAAHSDEDRTRVPVVTPICFEATKSDLCRRLVYEGGARRAAIIINMSNDGWFGDLMGGREQHLLAARWRCVELGLPMVRAVNTGISCSIDARGVLRKYGPDGQTQAVNVDGVLVDTVALAPIDGATIFARCGNAFGWIVLVLAALSPVLSWKALRFPRTNKAA